MLGVVFAPSLIYCASSIFYLPESPRWLMSKGRMLEARQVLQRLRRKQDVSGEHSFSFNIITSLYTCFSVVFSVFSNCTS